MAWILLDESSCVSVNVGRRSFKWKDRRNPASGVEYIVLDEWEDSYALPVPPDRVRRVRVVVGKRRDDCPLENPSGPTVGGEWFHKFRDGRIVLTKAIPDDARVEIEVL